MLDKETEHFIITPTTDNQVYVGIKFTDGLAPLCRVKKTSEEFTISFTDQALQDYIVDWNTYQELIMVLDGVCDHLRYKKEY